MQQHNSTAGVHLPLVNEIAAVAIGCGVGNPHVDSSLRESVEKNMSAWKTSNPDVDLVYAQNTPDELNIVVPEFPEVDDAINRMSESDLAQVAGGELFIAGAIAFAFGSIGATIGIGSVSLAVGVGASLSAVVAGAVIVGAVVGAGVAAVGTSVALGVGLDHKGSAGGAGIRENIDITS